MTTHKALAALAMSLSLAACFDARQGTTAPPMHSRTHPAD